MSLRARFSNLQPRDRRAVRLGAWILLPSLAMAFVIKPYASALLANRAMLRSDRDLLARESLAVTELPSDIKLLNERSRTLRSIEPRLFVGSDAITASAELARYVSARATQSGLRLEQTETDAHIDSTGSLRSASARPSGYERGDDQLRVTIRARGGILAVYTFLRAMETGPRLVGVERIDITRSSTDDVFDGTLTLTATVAGIALRKATDAGVTAEDEQ